MKLRYKIINGFLAVLAIAVLSLGFVLSYESACEPAPALADDATTMKAVTYRCYGSPDVLEYGDVEKPVPGENDVLIRVKAAGVNPLDWHYMRGSPYLMRLGSGIGAPKDPRIGVDFAGIVESVGSKVTRFQVGDEVFGGASGAFAEFVLMPQDYAVARKPANVSFEQSAGVAIAALTALQALRDKGELAAGQKVLINGASGGVGTYAVQIAKHFGAEVHGVCSTRNVEMVRSLGADRVFDYKKESYVDSGETYDLIVDMVGNHSLMANRRVMTPGGTLVLVGGPKGDWVGPLARPIGALILGPFVDQQLITLLARLNREDLEFIGELMAAGELTTRIDTRYPLERVADAIRHSEEGHARGKIILTME